MRCYSTEGDAAGEMPGTPGPASLVVRDRHEVWFSFSCIASAPGGGKAARLGRLVMSQLLRRSVSTLTCMLESDCGDVSVRVNVKCCVLIKIL